MFIFPPPHEPQRIAAVEIQLCPPRDLRCRFDWANDMLEAAEPDDEAATLHVFQSRYPTTAKNVGVNDVKQLIGTLAPLTNASSLEQLLAGGVDPELERLIERFEILERLKAGRLNVRGILVTAGKLTPQARQLIESTNAARKHRFLTAYDVLDLGPVVTAFQSPDTVKATVTVNCPANRRFLSDDSTTLVAGCRVSAKDIVNWPGILDRTLFDLNVRRELGRNRVRRALDRAVGKPTDHINFLAFHNGLTVVCQEIDAMAMSPPIARATQFFMTPSFPLSHESFYRYERSNNSSYPLLACRPGF